MASEVEICNTSLSHIRAGSINSLTEASLAAQTCNLHYSILRDHLLSQAGMGFNLRNEPLALLVGNVFNWIYSYQYPSDCLQIEKLILNFEQYQQDSSGLAVRPRDIEQLYSPDLEAQVKYKRFNVAGNRVIAANEAGLRVEYRARVTDPNLFSTSFTQALGHLLASTIAITIVGAELGRALQADHFKLSQFHMNQAMADGLNEAYTEAPESDFITVRG